MVINFLSVYFAYLTYPLDSPSGERAEAEAEVIRRLKHYYSSQVLASIYHQKIVRDLAHPRESLPLQKLTIYETSQ